jgi:hypothetical protein
MARPRIKRSVALSKVIQTRVTRDDDRKFTMVAKTKGLTPSIMLRNFIVDTNEAFERETLRGLAGSGKKKKG